MLAMCVPELPFQLAAQRDASLRERPLAFLSPLPGRVPTLWLLNRAARAEGLKAGDPMDSALHAVHGLRVLDPQPHTWWEAQGAYQGVLERWSPQGRLVRLGEALVELRGTERLYGPPKDAATRLRRELHRSFGWQSQGGLSRSATAATVAAHVGDASHAGPLRSCFGVEMVPDGCEGTFLAPQLLGVLPDLAVRPLSRLRRLGLRTVGDLQPLPCRVLAELMPERAAQELLQKARGEDRPKLPLFADPPGSSRHPWRLEPPCLPEQVPLASWALHRLWDESHRRGDRALPGRHVGSTRGTEREQSDRAVPLVHVGPRSLSLRWWDLDGAPHFWRLEDGLMDLPPLVLAKALEAGFRERGERRLLVRQLELRLRWGLGQAVPLFQEEQNEKLQRLENTLGRLRKRYPDTTVQPGWVDATGGAA